MRSQAHSPFTLGLMSITAGSLLAVLWGVSPAPAISAEQRSAARAEAISVAGTGDGAAFTVAAVPDTQGEVFGSDPRMKQRFDWLVAERAALDLRFVSQVGDWTNWGWLDRPQLTKASAAMNPLEVAGIPWAVSIGNHDTRAVGWDGKGAYGGSAYVENPECVERFSPAECKTPLLLRHTEEINEVLDAERFGAVRGAFEPGKIDNVWSTFSAGGRRWMALSLELWPRPEAVTWARSVVRAHPHHNVILTTHSYLDAQDRISASPEYGSTSPAYVWENLISRSPNVKVVLSGHTGDAGMRIDRTRAGTKVVSLRTNFSRTTTNPTRLLTFKPGKGVLHTRIVAPYTGETLRTFSATVRGMSFVR